jgi:hypothetical protein
VTTSVFVDKLNPPDETVLAAALGDAMTLWRDIRNRLEGRYGALVEDWKFYSKKSGWTMKLLLKKRNLFFSFPQDGCFSVSFVFGDKAVALVQQSSLPETIVSDLVNARKYAEGRGVLIEVKSPEDVGYIVKLVEIKLQL